MKNQRKHDPHHGFSLLELIVVMGILALLTGLILAGVQAARQNAARLDCQSRLRQLGVACQNFHAAHGHYPQGVSYPFSKSEFEKEHIHAGISWQTSILPFLEQDAIWRQAWAAHVANPNGNDLLHNAVAAHRIPAFRCPSDPRMHGIYSDPNDFMTWGLTNYLGVAGENFKSNDGMFHPDYRITAQIVLDGTSNTLFIGERPTAPNGNRSTWYSDWGTYRFFSGQIMAVSELWANNIKADYLGCPTHVTVFEAGIYDNPCHHGHYWSLHPGGANFAFADGSVRFLRYSAAEILPALATAAGRESVVLE